MVFTDIATIRTITGLTTDDYTDDEVQEFIDMAQKEVVSKLQERIVREKVEYIDSVRANNLNEDTTFYLKKWRDNYIGDMDYNGTVNKSDIIIYYVDDDEETSLVPLSVDTTSMSFTLNSIPGSDINLYTTYCYTPYSFTTPDPRVALATAYLASSYLKLTESGGSTMGGGDDARSIRIGNLAIGAGSSASSAYYPGKVTSFYDKYMEIMSQLIDSSTGGAIWGESLVKI